MSASTPFDDGATTNTGEERENLTWQEFGDAARELAQQIRVEARPDRCNCTRRTDPRGSNCLRNGCEGHRYHEPRVLYRSG